MKKVDIWFARFDDEVYVSVAPHGDAPTTQGRKIRNVTRALEIVRNNPDYEVSSVGIVPADFLGLD